MSKMGGQNGEGKAQLGGLNAFYNRTYSGAQHPPRTQELENVSKKSPLKKSNSGKTDSFLDYQNKTLDAWDASDDDLSDLASSKMSIKSSRSKVTSIKQPQQMKAQTNLQITSGAVTAKGGGMTRSNPNDSIVKRPHSSSAPSTPSHLSGHRFVSGNSSGSYAGQATAGVGSEARDKTKHDKFKSLLSPTTSSSLDLEDLRKASWSGVPAAYRPTAWKLLSGYLPAAPERREGMLERKQTDYLNFVRQYYHTREDDTHEDTYHQIRIDVPRMSPLIPLFQQPLVQDIFERILFIWAIRHPASGYVQGINDLVTPFFVVFLAEYVAPDVAVETCQVSDISEESLQRLEADCFWCFSKLLDGIQDNYTFAQPGIQTRITALEGLVARIDGALHRHLRGHNVEYLQFSFRWMNNLLMREMPLSCVIRLWDTYLSEPDGFASFHLYVCAAFLTRFSADLQKEQDFHGLMLLLQNLPTHHWSNDEIGLILADAYRLKYTFADAPNHFKDGGASAAQSSVQTTTRTK